MNNSTLTIRTVGFRRLCRGYFRVLFSGFYSQKGVNLSPPVVGLGPFWVLVDLFTGLVVPTTCSLTTCIVTHFQRELGRFSDTLSAGKTGPDQSYLWINLTAVIA